MFDCTKCGACCRHIAGVLPDFDLDDDGICRYLTKDNLCRIYDNRPFICNVDRIYNDLFEGSIDRKEFYKTTKEACKILQAQEG